MVRVLLSLLAVIIMFGAVDCQQNRFPQMYEISTRPWLYLLSQKYGRNITTLNAIPMQEFSNLKNAGYDIVWLMGVWQLGAYGLNYDQTNPSLLAYYSTVLPGYTKADIIGSPYAVVDYTCNSELGSDSDIASLRSKLNSMGLKLMLDFVPNHSAVDDPWTSTHIEYYVRAPSKSPPYDPSRYMSNGIAYGWSGWGDSWQDTAQYNYWNMNFRTVITKNILKIASLSDYIRCDMAYLLLNDNINSIWSSQLSYWGYSRPSTEFWSDAISYVKSQYPNVQFLGEVYSPWQQALQNVGFDFTYDKTLYDHLSGYNLDDIRSYISNTPLSFHQKSAHFVENHDEPRAAYHFGTNYKADAAAIISMTLPGMRFYFMGQEDGYYNKLDIHLRRAAPEAIHDGVPQFYSKFVNILSMDVFHSGVWTYLTVGNSGDSWRLMAWKWALAAQKVLVVINFSDTDGSGSVVLSDAQPINGNDTIPVTELFSNTVYQRSAKEMRTTGLNVVVSSWSAQIFQYN
eukprot:TRINITY_DN4994_c0_g1_i1.p1 TRINITY_DN4994_c0_g1~~TRINITY_DN4994_c0_g1_i1.p1  ORF type:complete len:512 (+),score=87.70 TRINITY_DN4994_c0_g1_i1:405-1940(+)